MVESVGEVMYGEGSRDNRLGLWTNIKMERRQALKS